MTVVAKKCPQCFAPLTAEEMLCKCGYDFTMTDCPGCDARIPDDSVLCLHCQYDLIEDVPAGKKPPRKVSTKPKPVEVEERLGRTIAVRNRKERVFVPSLHSMASWVELTFSGPETDAAMIEWATRLRRRGESENIILMNHAIGYVAEYSGHKFLERNAMRLRDLLGGDDWK